MSSKQFVIHILVVTSGIAIVWGSEMLDVKNKIYFQSVKCIINDKSYVKFGNCSLKAINRTMKTVTIRGILLKPPILQAHLNFAVLKKANGYKPFLIKVTLDICQYFTGKKNIIFDWFYKFMSPYSNINHTCPYFHDMVIKDLPDSKLQLPSVFPEGEYRIDLEVFAEKVLRATINMFISVKEFEMI